MAFPFSDIPLAVLADSYKATHFLMYPEAKKMVAYGEFRSAFESNPSDSRLVFYGIRHIVETYVSKKWTVEDVEKAERFYGTHNAGFTPFPFPKDLFLKFIKENDGYFPVKIEALPEGSVVHVHTPVYQITASEPYSHLCTFLETIMTQLWYPTSVATLSRMTKDAIKEAFDKSVDEQSMFLLNSRLHDFGFRGCTSVEQAVIGGSAHLLNFEGSDTMAAAYYIQFALNNGKPVATSIPATEHSVMTSWKTEKEAILNSIAHFGTGLYSTVMDSYDYQRALEKVVPSVKTEKLAKGGVWVFRPDSGDPVEAVMMGLQAGENAFGTVTNSKGYKVIKGAAVIQGDGINMNSVKKILEAVLAAKFSAENVVFGMGGGLLQKVNRDTMSFATKLSFIQYANGEVRDIMKLPKTDKSKTSLPGIMRVKKDEKGLSWVHPREGEGYDQSDILKPVYDMRPISGVWDDFETIRKRVSSQWEVLPKTHDPIVPALKTKIDDWVQTQRKLLAEDKV
eukprot:TRINITY_DN3561_c0_g1_i1.p1 TRINITY_DN3561_c0_g1~~TRINITY_DN3561_c0_g1_i1.p1  ORF type:complete len:508 (-),score=143.22 TRINITY_DN3561_c0_g1_i1:21-1544(-)